MKYISLSILATSIAFYGCNKKAEVKSAVNVSYTMKSFKLESETGCSEKEAPTCAYYVVNYPVFEGIDSTITNIITHRLDSIITEGYAEAGPQTIQQTGAEFIRQFNETKAEDPASQQWYFSATVGVSIASDTLISLAIFRDEFTGGAHPNSRTDFLNINPVTGKTITLADELKEGYEDELTKLGEHVFRKVRELPDTASLQGNYFEFANDKFQLNNNYGFTKYGILFFYNSYEVAPYAAGPTEVLIPYGKLKDWLR